MTREVPENLKIVAFNDTINDPYALITMLGKNIRQRFRIIKYFSQTEGNLSQYALFHSRLSYFNTDVFLIKNFSWVDDGNYSLFEDISSKIEYLIDLNPSKMYILLIYSDEIKSIEDVMNFICTNELNLKLSLIESKRIKHALHRSVEMVMSEVQETQF